jgi:hypothetical protein
MEIMLFNSKTAPAHVRAGQLSETAIALSGGAGNNIKRISTKGGVFRLMAGGKEVANIEERHLDIVIVLAAPKVSRVFYAAAYDSDKVAPPDCSSTDGETPDVGVPSKQSDSCMGCPQNIAGSGNGNSRACRYQQRLAVVLEDAVDGDVLQLTLPATSIFGKDEGDKRPLQAYARFLANQNPPVNPEAVVTRMRFDTKAEAPKLFFQPMRWLTDAEYATVMQQAATPDAKRAIASTVAAVDGVKVEPLTLAGKAPSKPPVVAEEEDEEVVVPTPPKAKKAKPAPAAAAVEEEEAEPEVRKTATKVTAVPAKKGSLSSIVAGWDDE